jgi:transposase
MRPPDLVKREEVATLYASGMSIRQIAEKLGKSFQAIQSMLVRMGIPRRPRGGNQGPHSRHRK